MSTSPPLMTTVMQSDCLFFVCVCIYDNKPVCRVTKTMFKVFLDDKRQKDTW